jgi:phosphatidate cytidylyltransferase
MGFVVVLALVVLFRRNSKPLESVPATLFIVLYAPFFLNFLAKVVTDWPEGDGRYLALYMILIVKMTDIGAYFTGRAIGRHKVFPRISPGKTWEGCIGGVIVATIAGIVAWWAVRGDFGVLTLRIADAVALGVLLSIAGILGDLIESMLKRAAGVKDSGEWIRGMGGVLDVIDSLLLASPVLYVYVHILRT